MKGVKGGRRMGMVWRKQRQQTTGSCGRKAVLRARQRSQHSRISFSSLAPRATEERWRILNDVTDGSGYWSYVDLVCDPAAAKRAALMALPAHICYSPQSIQRPCV